MTEQEAIAIIKKNYPKCCKMVNGRYEGGFDDTDCELGQAFNIAIKALTELQQYRAIGTMEELQIMKEHGGFTGVELVNIAAMQMKLKEYEAIGTSEELQDMKSNYFEALSDWRQYRKIGTLEECRTAREKQIPKKPDFTEDKTFALCPCCNGEGLLDKQKYCDNCGQKLDWSDEE